VLFHKAYIVYGRMLKYRCGSWEYSPIESRWMKPIPYTSAVAAVKRSVLSPTSVRSVVGIALNERKAIAQSILMLTLERWSDE
jgi:hypothetical protein